MNDFIFKYKAQLMIINIVINLSYTNLIIYKYKLDLKYIILLKLFLNIFLIIFLLNIYIYNFIKIIIKNQKIYI